MALQVIPIEFPDRIFKKYGCDYRLCPVRKRFVQKNETHANKLFPLMLDESIVAEIQKRDAQWLLDHSGSGEAAFSLQRDGYIYETSDYRMYDLATNQYLYEISVFIVMTDEFKAYHHKILDLVTEIFHEKLVRPLRLSKFILEHQKETESRLCLQINKHMELEVVYDDPYYPVLFRICRFEDAPPHLDLKDG